MENASKALIMAAAALIAVLVVTLIVYLYSSFNQDKKENIELMNQTQLIAFNGKYLAYDGKEDLTYYDIANIATMARNDNKENEEKISVILKPTNQNLSINDGNYSTFMQNLNNKDALDDSDSLIMKDEEILDLLTGKSKRTRVLRKYRCVVSLNTVTGRVETVEFFNI